MYQLVLMRHEYSNNYFLWGYDSDSTLYYTGQCVDVISAMHTHNVYKLNYVEEPIGHSYTFLSYFKNIPDLIDHILIESITGNTSRYISILTCINPPVVNREYYQIVQSLLSASSAGAG